ncbi:MAG: Alpha/beta hydrolase family [Cyanobacteria bacterium RYN_339]|nr:Alpha/beta hydrolase family [Cyanobacteria bacterium RYN_339]
MRLAATGVAAAIATLFGAYMLYGVVEGSRQVVYHGREDFHQAPNANLGLVQLTSDYGEHLAAWWIPAATPTKDAILVIHGRGANKDSAWKKFGFLHSRYNLFIYDQRACGESEGTTTSLGFFERRDAQKALDWLDQHGQRVAVLGESLGGAVAIDAAARSKQVLAVVSDCAFDSAVDAIAPRVTARGYPLAGALTQAILVGTWLRLGAWLPEADPVKAVGEIAPRPLLLIHGSKDDETLPVNAERLFAAAGQPKRLWWTPVRHGESWAVPGYQREVLAFFGNVMK